MNAKMLRRIGLGLVFLALALPLITVPMMSQSGATYAGGLLAELAMLAFPLGILAHLLTRKQSAQMLATATLGVGGILLGYSVHGLLSILGAH